MPKVTFKALILAGAKLADNDTVIRQSLGCKMEPFVLRMRASQRVRTLDVTPLFAMDSALRADETFLSQSRPRTDRWPS